MLSFIRRDPFERTFILFSEGYLLYKTGAGSFMISLRTTVFRGRDWDILFYLIK